MGRMRKTFWYLVLVACGCVAAALALNGHLPKDPFDAASWTRWFEADPTGAGGLAFTTLISVGSAIALVLQLFGGQPITAGHLEPLATKDDIARLEALFAAKLASERAPGAPALDAANKAAQAAVVSNILASTDPLDSKARAAVERTDVAGTIAALLEAAKADRANAARRYREAGSLLYDRNIAQAIDAYEQAALLEPTMFWDWIFLSRLHRSAGHLTKARACAEKALAAAPGPRDVSVASNDMGDVLVQRGDLVGALKYYRSGLDIARELVAADEGDGPARRDLVASLNRVGDVLRQQGDLSGALKDYREALDIVRDLAAANDHREAKRDLFISLMKIGDTVRQQGEVEEALASYRDGLDMARALAELDENDLDIQRDIFVSSDKVSVALRQKGDLEGALKSCQDALGIARRCVAADENDAVAWRDLTVSLNRLGDVLMQQSDLEGALKAYREAMDISRKLAAADESDAQAQRDFSISLNKIGDVLLQQGDPTGASKSYFEAFEIACKLAAADGSDAQVKMDLGVSHDKLARAFEAMGEFPGAIAHFEQSEHHFQEVATLSPDWSNARVWAKGARSNITRLNAALAPPSQPAAT